MRARSVALVLGCLAVGPLGAGCSPTSAPDPSAGTLPTDDAEATLLTVVTTVPDDDDLPAAIAAQLAATVPEVVGVVFEAAQTDCVARGIVEDVDGDDLRALGLGGTLAEQPLGVQAGVFAVFDDCVDPKSYARIAAPILMNAGAQQPVAECVFRELRERLGFAGLYTYAYENAGGAAPTEALADQVAEAYDACDLSPTELSVPIGPPTSVGTPSTTTSSTSTTSPGQTVATVASSTVVPPVRPPEDPVVTTTRPRPTTTPAVGGATSTTAVATS